MSFDEAFNSGASAMMTGRHETSSQNCMEIS